MRQFTKYELKLLSALLDEVSDEYANHTCNDYTLKNTPENKEFLIQMILDNGDEREIEEEIPEIKTSTAKKLFTSDCVLLSYFSKRCLDLSKGE